MSILSIALAFILCVNIKNVIKKAINKKMIKLEIKLSTASSCISTEISMVTILLLLMNVNLKLMMVRPAGWIWSKIKLSVFLYSHRANRVDSLLKKYLNILIWIPSRDSGVLQSTILMIFYSFIMRIKLMAVQSQIIISFRIAKWL